MHRFYRDRKQDKPGAGFLVAAAVTLVAALLVGRSLLSSSGKEDLANVAGGTTPAGASASTGLSDSLKAVEPKAFTVHLLQVGAYATQEQAQKAVSLLADHEVSAAMAQEGELYKVFAGAYLDANAAETVKTALMPKLEELKMGVYNRPVSLTDTPSVMPTTAGSAMVQPMQQGAQEMNMYLQQAAAWLEGYASGETAGADVLSETAGRLGTQAKSMAQYEQDSAVGQYLAMVRDAGANSQAITKLSQSRAASDYQAALGGYVTLLQEYKVWTMSPAN